MTIARSRSRRAGTGALSVAIVAAGPDIIGGHAVQARLLGDALAQEGVRVRHVAINRRFPRPIRPIRRVRGLRTIVNEALYGAALAQLAGADVVHAFSAAYWSFLLAPVPAMLAGRAAGARVILHYHSGEIEDHLARWGWRVHPWLRLADEIVVCSEFQRRVLAEHGHEATVIPNLADVNRFPFRRRVPLAPRLLCNRNMEPHYGLDVVLDAYAAIRRARPDATLTLAGDGSERARLGARVSAERLAGVTFVGAVDPVHMPALVADHDVLLNGSRVDNQPVSLIEAFAAGVVVVSTRAGAIPEMIEHGRSGMLVECDDARGMAEAVLALVGDPERAASMAAAARDGLDRYAWATVRERWARAYGHALGAPLQRGRTILPFTRARPDSRGTCV